MKKLILIVFSFMAAWDYQCQAVPIILTTYCSWYISPKIISREKILAGGEVIKYGVAKEFFAFLERNDGGSCAGIKITASVVKHDKANTRWPCCPGGAPYDEDPNCWIKAEDMYDKWGFTRALNKGKVDKNNTFIFYCGLGNRAITWPDWIPAEDSWCWYPGLGENETTYLNCGAFIVFRYKPSYEDEVAKTGAASFYGRWSDTCGGGPNGFWTESSAYAVLDSSPNKEIAKLVAINFEGDEIEKPLTKLPAECCSYETVNGWNQYHEPNSFKNVIGILPFSLDTNNSTEDLDFSYPYVVVFNQNDIRYEFARKGMIALVSRSPNNNVVSTMRLNFKDINNGLLVSEYIYPISNYCGNGLHLDSAGNPYRCIWVVKNGSLEAEIDWLADYNWDGWVNLVDYALETIGRNEISELFLNGYLEDFRPTVNLYDYAFLAESTMDYKEYECLFRDYLKKPR